MAFHIRIAGVLLILLALVHLIFPKYFDWARELGKLSLINRQMMYVHTFFIALFVLLTGLLCLTSAEALAKTDLGRKVALGLGIFWTIRLFFQFFGYSSSLWKGKRRETVVHVLFSFLWIYLGTLFLLVYWR